VGRPTGHGVGYEARRQEIIDQAAQLFSKHGYAATGMVALGDYVGLRKGALYHYVGSKEALLVEIQDRVLQPLLSQAQRIVSLDADPVLRICMLSESLLEIIFSRLDHIWVYEHDYRHLTGDNLRRFIQQRRLFEDFVQRLLTEAIAAGKFRQLDPRLATLQFLNLHNHTYQWLHVGEQRWTPSTLSSEYCQTLLRGFGADGADFSDLTERVNELRDPTAHQGIAAAAG
jgi:TetR/AcrR family transcriptional regulator, cholesterol catabolism regulator